MSNLAIGVLGVLAVAATGKWGKQAFVAIRAAITPDHKALYRTPAWGLMAVGSGGPSSAWATRVRGWRPRQGTPAGICAGQGLSLQVVAGVGFEPTYAEPTVLQHAPPSRVPYR